MKVTKRSIITGELNTIDLNVTTQQLQSFERGEGSLQTIFFNLTDSEREFINSGIIDDELSQRLCSTKHK